MVYCFKGGGRSVKVICRLSFMLILLLVGCSSGAVSSRRAPSPFAAQQAILTVYLTSSGTAEQVGQMRLEELAIEADEAWISLDFSPVTVDYQKQKGEQFLLGAFHATLGEHRSLRLRVSGLLSVEQKQDFYLTLADPLLLARGDSKCLFLDWSVHSELYGNNALIPVFSAWGQRPVLGSNLLYAVCSELNTVYVTRIDTNQVVASFGLAGPLAEICLDAQRQRLYALSKGRRSIYVYDCLNDHLLDQILIPASVSPEHMVLSANAMFAYVSDPDAGAVYKVDLNNGRIVASRQIGHRPGFLSEIEELNSLAVSSSSSNQVFVLDSQTLELKRVLPVGSKPLGLLYFSGALYVAEFGDQSVSVFNPQSGRQLSKISVGPGPYSLLQVDSDTVYVSNSAGQTVSVLTAGQNIAFRQIGSALYPTEMVYSQRRRLLYAASADSSQLMVIDPGKQELVKRINYGGQLKGLALLEAKLR